MTPIIIIGFLMNPIIISCLVIAIGVFVCVAQWFGADRQFWRDFRRIARHEHQEDQQ